MRLFHQLVCSQQSTAKHTLLVGSAAPKNIKNTGQEISQSCDGISDVTGNIPTEIHRAIEPEICDTCPSCILVTEVDSLSVATEMMPI